MDNMVEMQTEVHCFQPATPELAVEQLPKDLEKNVDKDRGGWRTFPFIIGSELCAVIAVTGLAANMIVYLTTEFNINNIEATHIINISSGGIELAPLIGAFLTDAYLGRFWAISIGSVLSTIAMILLMLTAIIDPLRPSPCSPNLRAPGSCVRPTTGQYGVLYLYFALLTAGAAGAKYNSAAFGADQFVKGGGNQHQSFFNWYYCVFFVSIMIASTVIVYIQSNVSWAWGFGICVALKGISLVLFLSGTRFYNCISPKGSPFTGLAQVVVASLRKRHLSLPSNGEDFYYGVRVQSGLPLTQQFRFLNKAAIKTSQDISADGHSNLNPWRLCTVQQVEELKSIIKTLTIWSGIIIPAILYTQQNTFSVLQALTMDRHLGSHFKIPAASYIVFNLLACAITLGMYENMVVPWAAAKGIKITQLRRIATGMVINIVGMAVAAIVERKRLNRSAEESAFWLLPQHVFIGVGEGFLSAGRIDFFYSEFPETVRSTATGLVAASMATGFYLSSLLVSIIHQNTDWLNDGLNYSRLDCFYGLLCVMGVLNFCYFTICARWYKYKAKIEGSHNTSTP
ncbi:hypothetical protein SUGI_0915210 [Cryptomeria japonica]|nr:hypothetical protein SUGI_0915210 [Cryptomeria japonica]